MAPPKGNQFWKMRTKHGRDKLFSNPAVLADACQEYFQWAHDNPLEEEKIFHTNGVITRATVAKMRAMTISGLCIFLGISTVTWFDYAKQDGFSNVAREAEEIIRTQKFEGAAAEMLNANIIARDLGLAEKKEVTGHLDLSNSTDEELENKIRSLIEETNATSYTDT